MATPTDWGIMEWHWRTPLAFPAIVCTREANAENTLRDVQGLPVSVVRRNWTISRTGSRATWGPDPDGRVWLVYRKGLRKSLPEAKYGTYDL